MLLPVEETVPPLQDEPQPVDCAIEPCHPPCTIASQTFKHSPSNRARTKLGVGEEVTITVTGNPAAWAISEGDGGRISPSGV